MPGGTDTTGVGIVTDVLTADPETETDPACPDADCGAPVGAAGAAGLGDGDDGDGVEGEGEGEVDPLLLALPDGAPGAAAGACRLTARW